MPKRTDIRKVMIIGSGPIIIGQSAEFDFSGSQAAKAVKEEGYEVVIVNSNPATIQTDMDMADAVYLEPLTIEVIESIIAKERPNGILSGMGGQTALNLCSELNERGILKKYGLELLGTPIETIRDAEDREAFRDKMTSIGEPTPKSKPCHTLEEAEAVAKEIGFPVIVRAAYTLGGLGSGIVENMDALQELVPRAIAYSRIRQVLVEECITGWKEFEYEVMRDGADNCVTVCNMENLDPMGIHTGESIVIAPAQTLTDREHQMLRQAAIKIIRALNIKGGCNVQFAVNPENGDYRVIEVNPRVSRSSALASKATGYPIARVAAKIAIGMTLDEIPNKVTGETFASFEPTLDYVILKIPKWPFDKFRTADRRLGTGMKSTGEVMAIGRTIEETIIKALRSLDGDTSGLEPSGWTRGDVMKELAEATDKRIYAIADALRQGYKVHTISDITKWDPFFIEKINNIVQGTIQVDGPKVFKMVDTCGAEFAARTPYYYSTLGTDSDLIQKKGSGKRKVLLIGSGPIRIGQGIEFDYCCVHGVMAVREAGAEALIINNNPETVSTDFDISDRLFFDPITLEDVVRIIEAEDVDGVVLQFGGQTAVNLAIPLQRYIDEKGSRCRIYGTTADSMDLAEDRRRFGAMMDQLGILQPAASSGLSFGEVREVATRIGYPVLVRPSYVLGGRGMEIVYGEEDLERYMREAVKVSRDHPVLVDKYLSHAIEIDVDAVSDKEHVFIGGIMEHIEEAGVHSGDASCVIPSQTLSPELRKAIEVVTVATCKALRIIGLVNLQLAIKDGKVFMLEANPRGSRTVPFISKAIGRPLAKIATRVMLGETLMSMAKEYNFSPHPIGWDGTGKGGVRGDEGMGHVAVKAPVFPFLKLPGVDAILGPEMKSTGEVMGIGLTLGTAYYKAMLASMNRLPLKGNVFISVKDEDKPGIVEVAKALRTAGFGIFATRGTAYHLRDEGVAAEMAWRITDRKHPDAIDLLRQGEIHMVINTSRDTTGARRDGYQMRRVAIDLDIPFINTMAAAQALANAIVEAGSKEMDVNSLKGYLGLDKR